MPEVSLDVLRGLRDRASSLLRNIVSDLTPFKKEDGTFRRKPDSRSPAWDTNVTTTCSCLMALASTDKFRSFFKEDGSPSITPAQWAAKVFQTLLDAPWMSSGLTENNAFTTTLVLRAYGFLEQEHLFGDAPHSAKSMPNAGVREWDLHLGIRNAVALARKLRKHSDPASEFLWFSLTDDSRNLIADSVKRSGSGRKRLKGALGLDLGRIIQSSWIHERKRFKQTSTETKEKLKQFRPEPTGYRLASLNRRLLADQFPRDISRPSLRSLKEIAEIIAGDPNNFSINQYPPSPAVVYWFVDAITRAEIRLSPGRWDVLCRWAAKEFTHRRSLVVARHDAMMDPVAMGMCACLCARLREITEKPKLGTKKEHLTILPSRIELERSIEELFSKQADSGIWNKYFPLFHYQDAGSNFCFTFELLEAVLYEFGKDIHSPTQEFERSSSGLLGNQRFVEGLEKAVAWCENNRLSCSEGLTEYKGWNSGGQIETLEKGQPESWATAVVHMFLSELTTVLSGRIQQQVLRKYKARLPKAASAAPTALGSLLDIDVLLRNRERRLSSILRTLVIKPYRSQSEVTLRRKAIKEPLSALLFGPPGTSKTEIARAIAADVRWPLIELTPSEFVKGSLANIYLQADAIFDDLMDLSAVVVFFDEMDALVQTREGQVHLDIESQFLTTTMLPKLTRLHDQARVIFLMATNFQERFDAAIKRAGRFDLLLCMGPPRIDEKLERLHRAYLLDDPTKQTKKAGRLIEQYLDAVPGLQDQLALFTFGDYKAFLNTLGKPEVIGDAIATLGARKFREKLKSYSRYVGLKMDELEPLKQQFKAKNLDQLRKKEFTLEELKTKGIRIDSVVRYLCDWQQSNEQY